MCSSNLTAHPPVHPPIHLIHPSVQPYNMCHVRKNKKEKHLTMTRRPSVTLLKWKIYSVWRPRWLLKERLCGPVLSNPISRHKSIQSSGWQCYLLIYLYRYFNRFVNERSSSTTSFLYCMIFFDCIALFVDFLISSFFLLISFQPCSFCGVKNIGWCWVFSISFILQKKNMVIIEMPLHLDK